MANSTDLAAALQNGVQAINSGSQAVSSLVSAFKRLDAANITFTQNGTGAVRTTVDAELKNRVYVTDFGADSSGNTDSQAAIQNAINEVSGAGGEVLFPPGDYLLNSAISITTKGIVLRGIGAAWGNQDGKGARLLAGANFNMVQVTGVENGWGIQNLTIDAHGTSSICLDLNDAFHGLCSNCTFLLANFDAIRMVNCSYNVFVQPFVSLPTTNGCRGIELNGSGASNSHHNYFYGLFIEHAGNATPSYGLYLDYCDANVFTGMVQSGGGAGNVGVLWDFGGAGGNVFPNSNVFIAPDIGLATQFQLVNGPPVATIAPDWFIGMTRNNSNIPPAFLNTVYTDGYVTRTLPIAVASLDAVTNNAGARAIVNNATATAFNSIVAGGGGNTVPVFCDGTNWRIG